MRLLRSTAGFFSGAVDEDAAAALAAELLAVVVAAELRTVVAVVVLGLVAADVLKVLTFFSSAALLSGAFLAGAVALVALVALERADSVVRTDELGFAAAAEAVRILVAAAV